MSQDRRHRKRASRQQAAALASSLLICGTLLGCSVCESPDLTLGLSDIALETPPQLADGWQVSAPEDRGLSSSTIGQFVAIAREFEFVNGVLVAKDGHLVAEAYFNGYGPNDAHQLASVSKGIISALVGIAIREGHFRGVSQPLAELLPEYFPADTDRRKRRITVHHLLTMTQGVASTDHGIAYLLWRGSGDRAANSLSRPIKYQPGERFDYSTGNAHLLSVALTKATGMSTRDFAEKYLFGPSGIALGRWDKDRAGRFIGGDDMYLTPRDLARFASLYLNHGRYKGRDIIPAEWIRDSTRPWVRTEPTSLWGEYDYGYYWWLKNINGHIVYVARGWGGQTIHIVPDHRLIVVTTGDWRVFLRAADRQSRTIRNVVEHYIAQAVAEDADRVAGDHGQDAKAHHLGQVEAESPWIKLVRNARCQTRAKRELLRRMGEGQ